LIVLVHINPLNDGHPGQGQKRCRHRLQHRHGWQAL
jgi:hypothetical protein